jgi:hypothetical protein
MTILGKDTQTGEYVSLERQARSRGVYVIGATGTGKTTLLQSIAYQDMLEGHGVCVLDPHGDMIDFLLARVPKEREQEVILFDPADVERPFGLNLLECDRNDSQQVRWVVSTLLTTLQRLFSSSWGPRLEHVLGHTLWTAMTIPDSTLVEVLLLLTDPVYRAIHTRDLTEPLLKNFWEDFPGNQNDRHELVSSTVNKLTPFLLDRGMRNIIGQPHSTINIREIMDNRGILLVNLSKGDLGENNSALLGSVIVNLILIAALSRRNMALQERRKRPFHVIVDEYQNFASESFSVLQSEARKYAVDLVVAHQYRDQLDDLNRGAALNVGNFICYRVTGIDSSELAMQFDNTPPEPDIRYETLKRQAPTIPGVFVSEPNAYVEVPQARRMYSDVAAERANTLANLPPFHALLKLIVERPDDGRLALAEYGIQALDPSDKTQAPYFGAPDGERVKRIRARSRARAPKQREVEARFRARTGGRASFSIPPASGEE